MAAGILAACVNGKDERGMALNPNSLPAPDTVATLYPGVEDFMVNGAMCQAAYRDFFLVKVDGGGVVTCYFRNTDTEAFRRLFKTEASMTDTLVVTGSHGRCRGVAVAAMEPHRTPMLLLLMEDDHAERLSLYDLYNGRTATVQRTAQGNITRFKEVPSDSVRSVIGLAIDGSRIELDWEPIEDIISSLSLFDASLLKPGGSRRNTILSVLVRYIVTYAHVMHKESCNSKKLVYGI